MSAVTALEQQILAYWRPYRASLTMLKVDLDLATDAIGELPAIREHMGDRTVEWQDVAHAVLMLAHAAEYEPARLRADDRLSDPKSRWQSVVRAMIALGLVEFDSDDTDGSKDEPAKEL